MKTTLLSASCMLTLAASGCLKPETAPPSMGDCYCSGVRCVQGIVGRLSESADEESDPCRGCHVTELGRCADGCGADEWTVPGCSVGYACKSWDRVAAGADCQSDRDCEPGPVGNTLGCENLKCVEKGAAKWEPAPAVTVCAGDPWFGPHPSCGQATCLGEDDFSQVRHCSAARCIADADCPTGWHCRCQEQPLTVGVRATRWCVPNPPAADAGI
jgi:hypothetical protein